MLIPMIREHILHRGKQKLPRPSDPLELRDLINSQNPEPKCTCNICDPCFYASFWHCPIHPHFHIKLEKDVQKNEFGNECYLPLKPSNAATSCESMHLARKTIEYFDRPKEELNDVQLHALRQLVTWRGSRINDILGKFQSGDRAALLPEKEMRFLWKCINELFFGRDSSRYFFRWKSHLSRGNVGVMMARPPLYFIKMKSKTGDKEHFWGGSHILDTVGTLVHEAVHAYLQRHACPLCWSTEWNLNSSGHGNVWQLLAARVEDCFVRFLKLPVDLGRFDSIHRFWTYFYPLPSKHDLEEWKLENALLYEFYCHDLMEWYQNAIGPDKFRIDEFYDKWWADGPRSDLVLGDSDHEKKWWAIRNGHAIKFDNCVGTDSEDDSE